MDIAQLSEKIIKGDRRALSRAITLIERARADHREQARDLLERLKDTNRKAIRIGLSGTPGGRGGSSSSNSSLGL